jgi:hypothetical protein
MVKVHVSELGGTFMRCCRSWLTTAFASTLFVATWGCDDGTTAVDTTTAEANVSGVIKVRGKPMDGGEITFDATNNKRSSAQRKATIGADGTYSITTLQGRNTARISSPMMKKEPQLAYGIHTIDVQPGENTFNIDLPPN